MQAALFAHSNSTRLSPSCDSTNASGCTGWASSSLLTLTCCSNASLLSQHLGTTSAEIVAVGVAPSLCCAVTDMHAVSEHRCSTPPMPEAQGCSEERLHPLDGKWPGLQCCGLGTELLAWSMQNGPYNMGHAHGSRPTMPNYPSPRIQILSCHA